MRQNLARIATCLFLLVAWFGKTYGQDPQYSQFYSNPTMLNPAFTGSGEGYRVAMNYRAQWVKIPGYYKQFAVSYDQPVYFLGTQQGLGLTVATDLAGEGDLRKTELRLNYAYAVELSDEHVLRFGLTAGFIQASVDFNKLIFPDQIDPRNGVQFPTQEPTFAGSSIREDVGAGVAYFNKYAWLGVTVDHLTQPYETFTGYRATDSRLPMKYTITGGLKIPLNSMRSRRELSVTPTFLWKQQGEFMQTDLGLYLNAEPMVFGVWYRHLDAVIGLIGVRQGPFSIGYSYDFTISDLSQNVSGGSHEIALVLEFEHHQSIRRPKHKKMPCPRF
ncbi:type IX secretion system membrane protein PorP/SprF [Pontibacter sp. G13]|uniref:PorP/SprF family type IX secretion system membrane protein n=1 Tax=Pontibacter sp. G13 TaxID=3074898 RepID=UPI00288AC0F8|nr:type IX secretion system membrane protein PorP/SprF [Pontibacter sp. G13]WNJ21286.1 type IX secretion system membrane protein PorP/SprF [Pontibacter sp. G13]